MLPYIKETPKSRTFIRTFGGYNQTPLAKENQMFDGYNFSTHAFPSLAVRKKRGVVNYFNDDTIVAALGDADEKFLLIHVQEDEVLSLYANGAKEDEYSPIAVVGEPVKGADYKLIRMGTKVLIYPCGKVYDTVTGIVEEYCQKYTVDNYTITNVYKQNNEYCTVCEGRENAKDGGYYFDTDFNETNGWSVKFYKKDEEEPEGYLGIDEESICLKITLEPDFFGDPENIKINANLDTMVDGVFELKKDYGKTAFCSNNNGKMEIIISGYMSFPETEVRKGRGLGTLGNLVTLNFDAKDKKIDFIVECQNRLWGCRSDGNINEIFCTALGSYNNWSLSDNVDDILSADSAWIATVGSPGKFTGAAVVDNTPIFFKENVIHKVYPSSQGAHQIHMITARGVQLGSHKSIARVGEYLYYKTNWDVVCFDGNTINTVSTELGEKKYVSAVGGSDGTNYIMYCEDTTGEGVIFVYDTRKCIWHKELGVRNVSTQESEKIRFILSGVNSCEFLTRNSVISRNGGDTEWYGENISFMFESGNIGMDTPDQKFLCRLDVRLKIAFETSLGIYIQYDSDGVWHQVSRLYGINERPKTECFSIIPQRCDHFKYKLVGTGQITLYGLSKIFEETENR